ncbi:UNVERIFIED_CONTAM: hypothetical protein Sradi_5272000 [Sesamum radiatum]|uniref:Uncharacterized protein n=1 Tax=Sesamum radiatum TaxID=300843 RepID=A0AAW2LLS8_SESRA
MGRLLCGAWRRGWSVCRGDRRSEGGEERGWAEVPEGREGGEEAATGDEGLAGRACRGTPGARRSGAQGVPRN